MILQLEETSVITDIDLGNGGAAFIELQVSEAHQWPAGIGGDNNKQLTKLYNFGIV